MNLIDYTNGIRKKTKHGNVQVENCPQFGKRSGHNGKYALILEKPRPLNNNTNQDQCSNAKFFIYVKIAH